MGNKNAVPETMVSLLERPLIKKDEVDMDVMTKRIHDFTAGLEKREQRLFHVEDRTWFFSYAELAREALRLLEVLDTSGVLLVSDIYNAQAPFSQPTKKDVEKMERRPLPSFCSLFFNPSRNWPRKEGMNGIYVIMGDTGSGKTTYIRTKLDGFIVRFGEPFEDVDFQEGVVPSSDLFNALSSAILLSAMGAHVALDSLRLVIYGLKGNPMEGGVISAVFGFCTELNNLFADLGISVAVALNPMLSDESKAHRLAVRLEASSAGVVHLVDRDIEYQSYRTVSGRLINEKKAEQNDPEESKDPGSRLHENSPRERGFDDSAYIDPTRIKESAVEDRVAHTVFGVTGDDADMDESVRPTAQFNL